MCRSVVEKDILRIIPEERLERECKQKFISSLSNCTNNEVTRVIIDFSEISYIDSAGLEVLLLAKSESERLQKKIELHNPSGQVKTILEASMFTKLFPVHYASTGDVSVEDDK